MNTYAKFCPNVYVAKCDTQHEKGDVIEVETKYGKTSRYVKHKIGEDDFKIEKII